jgi:hypothetical protein
MLPLAAKDAVSGNARTALSHRSRLSTDLKDFSRLSLTQIYMLLSKASYWTGSSEEVTQILRAALPAEKKARTAEALLDAIQRFGEEGAGVAGARRNEVAEVLGKSGSEPITRADVARVIQTLWERLGCFDELGYVAIPNEDDAAIELPKLAHTYAQLIMYLEQAGLTEGEGDGWPGPGYAVQRMGWIISGIEFECKDNYHLRLADALCVIAETMGWEHPRQPHP